ncbi:hypothetical protein [Streptomyces sp900116325]|uniref:hypothetical protein n=1 Tax=Streptomyces sp. 900116325 TaxID=3154295 RepID=UPI003409B7CB
MPHQSVPALGAAFGMPGWLAALAALALLAILALVAGLARSVLRRTDQADLPEVLLGLSHVVSSLCGLLPWGRPYSAPALSKPPEPTLTPTVVLLRAEPAVRPVGNRSAR